MTTILNTLSERARECQQLMADIDLIRPQIFKFSASAETVKELLEGVAVHYDARFDALLTTYSEAIKTNNFWHYELEECFMDWWGVCSNLRCAALGVSKGIITTESLDHILLGIRSLSLVHGICFFNIFDSACSKADSFNANKIEVL